MDKNLTEIIFLLDRSGSMTGLESDTIGGYNSFIKKQSSLGRTHLTTILFDDKYEILHNGIDAATVTLTEKEYYTRGSTALLDAVGKTIIDVNFRLSHLTLEAHPSKVVFVITTDGLENSSKEFTYDKVKNMISRQKEVYNWQFIFMGANIDVAAESHKLGINPSMAFSYHPSVEGTKRMYDKVNDMVYEMRLDQFKKPNDPLSKINLDPDS
ncbi:MAG: VWA domain-containing protein [Anaerolineaceae bacterium]|nr:MAG: VWA domain-containing protein [Anaerolineaceae bacterium]